MARSTSQWLDKARFAFFPGAFAVTVLAATSANAADVAGKWYGRLDSEPVITINKAGAGYSASLDYSRVSRTRVQGLSTFQESIDKSVASFKVTDGNVRFSIRSLISVHGDIDYELDEYDLNLSEDGHQLIGTVKTRFDEQGTAPTKRTQATITLFPTDWNTRSQP